VSRAWTGLAALLLAGGAAAQANPGHHNVTTGGPLRPGIYGRIVLKGKHVPPPPVIYKQPVIASSAIVPEGAKPVYLYVPPGQVRKWKRDCARWKACDEPVLFVRVDQSPSRWGRWRHLRDEVALGGQD
jgi:hypothetical protein